MEEAENIGGNVQVEVAEAEAYSEGTVGRGVARPIITPGDGTRVTPRWSAVFLHEDDDWKMIQLHASVAIANEQAFGDTFSA